MDFHGHKNRMVIGDTYLQKKTMEVEKYGKDREFLKKVNTFKKFDNNENKDKDQAYLSNISNNNKSSSGFYYTESKVDKSYPLVDFHGGTNPILKYKGQGGNSASPKKHYKMQSETSLNFIGKKSNNESPIKVHNNQHHESKLQVGQNNPATKADGYISYTTDRSKDTLPKLKDRSAMSNSPERILKMSENKNSANNI